MSEATRPGRRVAVLLLAAGAAYRLVLILLAVPTNDGDESIVGLMATHIAEGRDFPAYFYGQHYMGALEAYLAAPVVGLSGPTVLALRLPMVLAFYVATGWLLYRLTVRLYTPWFATAVTGLYALGSDHIVSMQLRASGGYPEMDLLGVLLVLLAVMLAERPRPVLFGLWGLVAGLVVWDTWLPLPYLAASAALLVAFRGVRWVPLAAAGFVVGAAPMIVHIATVNPARTAMAAEDRATRELIATLDRRGITRVYADYPICNQLTFRTGERIVCAVVGPDGRRGMDRYPPFRRMVDTAPDAAYVVPVGTGYRVYRARSPR